MVTIALICLIPVIALITGFFTLKAYSTGLSHNYDLKHDTKPIEVNPIKEFFNAKNEDKEELNQVSILSEWLNGKEE